MGPKEMTKVAFILFRQGNKKFVNWQDKETYASVLID